MREIGRYVKPRTLYAHMRAPTLSELVQIRQNLSQINDLA